jgi:hypothetical protein
LNGRSHLLISIDAEIESGKALFSGCQSSDLVLSCRSLFCCGPSRPFLSSFSVRAGPNIFPRLFLAFVDGMPPALISYDSLVHAVDLAAISLTAFNCIAACIVIVIVVIDSRRLQRSWLSLPLERRAPIYLAIAILLSHVIFITRESLEVGSFDNSEISDPGNPPLVSQQCTVLNQMSWWGTLLIRP